MTPTFVRRESALQNHNELCQPLDSRRRLVLKLVGSYSFAGINLGIYKFSRSAPRTWKIRVRHHPKRGILSVGETRFLFEKQDSQGHAGEVGRNVSLDKKHYLREYTSFGMPRPRRRQFDFRLEIRINYPRWMILLLHADIPSRPRPSHYTIVVFKIVPFKLYFIDSLLTIFLTHLQPLS